VRNRLSFEVFSVGKITAEKENKNPTCFTVVFTSIPGNKPENTIFSF
jgi:hypothetical protein